MAGTAASYQDRKAAAIDSGQCMRGDCTSDMADDSLYCPLHRDLERKRDAAKKRLRRKRRKRAGLCIECGKPRPLRQSSCEACRVARGRVPKTVRDGATADAAARAERMLAATRKHADGRTRYHGQQKRGNQPHMQLDGQDLGYARTMLDRGEAGLRWYETPGVQALPRIQREDVKGEALHQLAQAVGHVEDVMMRRDRKFFTHFESRHGTREGDDE